MAELKGFICKNCGELWENHLRLPEEKCPFASTAFLFDPELPVEGDYLLGEEWQRYDHNVALKLVVHRGNFGPNANPFKTRQDVEDL